MDIVSFRTKFPQYDHVSDPDLSRVLYDKFYSDKTDFNTFAEKFVGPSLPDPATTSSFTSTPEQREAFVPIPDPILPETPGPSISEQVVEGGKALAIDTAKQAVGLTEAASALANGLLTFIPSMAAGTGELIKGFAGKGHIDAGDFTRAVEAQQKIAGAFGQPVTKKGKEAAEFLTMPFTEWNKGWRSLAPEGLEDAYGFVGDAVLLGPLAIKVRPKGITGRVKGAYDFFRDEVRSKQSLKSRLKNIPERDLVVLTPEEYADIYKDMKAEGFTDAEIARMSDSLKEVAIRERAKGEEAITKPVEKPVTEKPVAEEPKIEIFKDEIERREKALTEKREDFRTIFESHPDELSSKEIRALSSEEFDTKLAEAKEVKEEKIVKEAEEFKLAAEEGRQVEGKEPKQTADLFTEKGFEEKLTPEETISQAKELGEENVTRLRNEQELPLEEEAEKLRKSTERFLKAAERKKKQKAKIVHFTKSENVNKILTEGFDTTLPPIHGTGGLEGGPQTGKATKDVLYFTTDKERWSKAQVFVGEGKGNISRDVYDYDEQKWKKEINAYKVINLSPIEAEIKSDAKILKIDSYIKAQDKFTDIFEFLDQLVNYAKRNNYDILHISDPGGTAWHRPDGRLTKNGDKSWHDVLTGNSGKNDFFILNKDAIKLEEPVTEKIIKQLTPRKFNPEKHSLRDAVQIEGGINLKHLGEELKIEIGETKAGKFLLRGKGQGLDADAMRLRMIDLGFLDEFASPDEFIAALKQDIIGEKRVFSSAKDPDIEALERELGKDVDEAIGEISPPAGLSVRQVGGKVISTPKYEFQDPEIGQKIADARGVRKPSLITRAREIFQSLGHKLTREFEHLPKNKEFAQVRFDLLKLAKAKGISSDRTLRAIQGITIGLDRNAYDIFATKVLLDDLIHTQEKGKEIPFGFTEESLKAELDSINKAIEPHPHIIEAIRKRNTLWTALRNDYVKAMRQIGLKVEKKFTNPNYFRHQVLQYANLKGIYGAGKKLKAPTGRGFLKERKGSGLDINTDYIQAEHEVMAQMIHDIEIARVIKNIDDKYNIAPKLRKQAKDKNFENLVGGPAVVRTINGLRSQKADIIASAEISEKTGKPKLDKEARAAIKKINDEIWLLDPTMPFKQKMAIAIAQLELDIFIEDELSGEMFKILSDMANEGSIPAKTVLKAVADKEKFIKESLGKEYLQWKQAVDNRLLPEGYTKWQPQEGHIFYMADSIPAQLASQLAEGKLAEAGITAADLRKVLARGGKRKEFIIKDEIAATLDNLSIPHSLNVISQVNKFLLTKWKIWTLISPRRFFKYNTRNLTGDADAVWLGNTSGFKKTVQAIKELYDTVAGDKAMTPDMQDWFSRGGMESTLQAQEMGELNRLKIFIDLHEKKGKTKEIPLRVWNKYWTTSRITTDFREAILRYANYLDYLEQMQNNKSGLPNNYGFSIREEIQGLEDIRDRAFFLSNDLLGAYDRISVFGKALREHLFPFWSFQEINLKRYYRGWKNASYDGRLASLIGKKFSRSPYTAYRIGKFLLKATAFWSALQAWNWLVFPDEEQELDEKTRTRPHIILGRDKDGKIINFTRIGVLGDFLEWFGLDAAPHYIDNWFSGKMTLQEIAKDMAKAPVNKFSQGMTPIWKVPAEIITRRSIFPDIFKTSTIRDRGLHIARSVGLENEYKSIMDIPNPGYGDSLPKFIIYKNDPLQSAYSDTYENKNRYLRKIGKLGEGYWITPRGEALYNFKLSLRYNDDDAAQRYLKEYILLTGGSVKQALKNVERSLMNMHPLSGMNQLEQIQFVSTLNPDDKEKLVKAIRFYSEVLIGGGEEE